MVHCIVCKDFAAESRYSLMVKDEKVDNHVDGFVCRHCYNKFIDSSANRGFFKLARFASWARERRDSMRRF